MKVICFVVIYISNVKKPELNNMYDDEELMISSDFKARNLEVRAIYPGHGNPFIPEDNIPDIGTRNRG